MDSGESIIYLDLLYLKYIYEVLLFFNATL